MPASRRAPRSPGRASKPHEAGDPEPARRGRPATARPPPGSVERRNPPEPRGSESKRRWQPPNRRGPAPAPWQQQGRGAGGLTPPTVRYGIREGPEAARNPVKAEAGLDPDPSRLPFVIPRDRRSGVAPNVKAQAARRRRDLTVVLSLEALISEDGSGTEGVHLRQGEAGAQRRAPDPRVWCRRGHRGWR